MVAFPDLAPFRCLSLAALLLAVPASSAATFDDADYHQEVLLEWDSGHLDILVLPPAAPYAPFRQQALLDNVEDYAAAIADHGASWLASGVDLLAYAPGLHALPPAGFEPDDVDIVIALSIDGVGGGLAVLSAVPCGLFQPPPVHRHPGSPWSVMVVPDCPDGPFCLIYNGAANTTQQGLFQVNGHELGHCLGLGHVGDAGDFSAAAVPTADVMSYSPSVSGCPSTLDLITFEAVFADTLGGTAPPLDVVGEFEFTRQDVDDYEVLPCDGPTPLPPGLPDPDWYPL